MVRLDRLKLRVAVLRLSIQCLEIIHCHQYRVLRLPRQLLQHSLEHNTRYSLVPYPHLDELNHPCTLSRALARPKLVIAREAELAKCRAVNGEEALEELEGGRGLVVRLRARVVCVRRGRVDEGDGTRDVQDKPVAGNGVLDGLEKGEGFA